MRICPNPKCRYEIENDNAKFCRKCGTALTPLTQPEEEPPVEETVGMPSPLIGDHGISLGDNPSQKQLSGDGGIPLDLTSESPQSAMPDTGSTINANPNPGSGRKMPNTYLVWSILATLFCCVPLGIYAIICSTKVSNEYSAGNYQKALNASDKAKKWTIISIVAGLVCWVASLLYIYNDFRNSYDYYNDYLYEEVEEAAPDDAAVAEIDSSIFIEDTAAEYVEEPADYYGDSVAY